jgi:hypothetical protein
MIGDVLFQLIPAILVISDPFAMHADRDTTFKLLDTG